MAKAQRSVMVAALVLGGAALSLPAAAGSQTEDDIKLFFSNLFGLGNLNKEYSYSKCGTQELKGVNPQTGEEIYGPYPCGGIAYANGGGYTVSSVKLEARGPNHQPSTDPTYKADCEGLSKTLSADVTLGKYDSFTVPASCAYKLSIKISGGDNKDQNVYLTPGCVVQLQSDGTTTMSNWKKVKTAWTPSGQQGYQSAIDAGVASETSVPKNPEDLDGHKCGEQSAM